MGDPGLTQDMVGMGPDGLDTQIFQDTSTTLSSTSASAAREGPVPKHIDMWLLDCEAKPEENTATQAVADVVLKEHIRQKH